MSITMIAEKKTLQMVNSEESKPVAEWKALYPNFCLFIEVTLETEWEVYEGRLIATAEDSIEFADLGKAYDERGQVSLTTWGSEVRPQTEWVA